MISSQACRSLAKATWLLALGAFFLGSAATAQNLPRVHPADQAVWFAPSFSYGEHPGSVDNLALFNDSAPWVEAKKRIHVFQVPTHTILKMSDDDLSNMLRFLIKNKIVLAIAYGILPFNATCGTGIEGFSPERMPTLISNRIKKLGGEIRYIAMDEPLHFARDFNGPNACHWNFEQIAQAAAPNIKQFRDVFPNVEIGDIEPIGAMQGNWLQEVRQWIETYRRVTGTALAFFHDDMLWREPVGEKTRALISVLDTDRIKIGVIFNSRGNVKSDEEWLQSAINNIKEYRSSALRDPDHVIIQSWRPYPTHVLPESNPYTLSHLLNYYFTGR